MVVVECRSPSPGATFDELRSCQHPPPDDPHSEANFDALLDDLKYDLLVEIADIVIAYADRVRDAALGNDRDRARLHAGLVSRAVKSMLITIAEIGQRRAA